jgi:hypothetical protein
MAKKTTVFISTSFVALTVLTISGTASAETLPRRWHDQNSIVIAHASNKAVNIVVGSNAIDKPHTFSCRSTHGCLVEFSPFVILQGSDGAWVCGYIDGKEARPRCPSNYSLTDQKQIAFVQAGMHTVQTMLNSTTATGQITGWETTYSVFELRAGEE